MNRTAGRIAAALVLAIVLVGLGAWMVDLTTHKDTPAASAPSTPGATAISIADFAFEPRPST